MTARPGHTPTKRRDLEQPARTWPARVAAHAGRHGWRTLLADPRRQPAWPDLTLCRPPRLVLVTLTTESDRAGPAQDWWHDLSCCPALEIYTWTSPDWDTVVEVLE